MVPNTGMCNGAKYRHVQWCQIQARAVAQNTDTCNGLEYRPRSKEFSFQSFISGGKNSSSKPCTKTHHTVGCSRIQHVLYVDLPINKNHLRYIHRSTCDNSESKIIWLQTDQDKPGKEMTRKLNRQIQIRWCINVSRMWLSLSLGQ